MGFFPDYTPLILMDHEPAWRIPIPPTHEHCFCQTTLDYIPHEQCCKCGQKRQKQGVTW